MHFSSYNSGIMENLQRYNHLNEYLKNKFGERTLKICIDGGFTCPNRDGKISTGGCIFCSERGSGEHLSVNLSITNQVQNYFKSYKATRANKFIAYFQNYTNTYADAETLKTRYDSALIDNRIVALAIATRPDCITEEIAKLLQDYSKKYYVFVELGLQTADENIATNINRGYTNEQFTNSVQILNKHNIDVVTHIMVGLPGEKIESIEKTVGFLNKHSIQGLKVHSCYVVKGTQLANMYENDTYTPISLEYYLEQLAYIITHIEPKVIIHRISGDAPKDLLLAPEWNLHKKWIMNGFDKIMRERDLYQGMYFNT